MLGQFPDLVSEGTADDLSAKMGANSRGHAAGVSQQKSNIKEVGRRRISSEEL